MGVSEHPPSAQALRGFGINSPDASRLLQFYERAFGARVVLRKRLERPLFASAVPIEGCAQTTVLSLGGATVELLQFDVPGRPYPPDLSPYDTRFQHLAIVVTDMQLAMQRLSQTEGWSAISTAGPQKLSDDAGGVTAFKFRDPDGHPLEFLLFGAGSIPAHWRDPAGGTIHQGIDHSALSVADPKQSVRFYESLGLRRSNSTLNEGIAQERLDGVRAPVVDVISLAPRLSTPHVELLHYRSHHRPIHDAPAVNDVASTRLIFSAGSSLPVEKDLVQDPDGHFLQFR